MTELQRNPKLISQASEEVQILDNRKKQILGVYTPHSKKAPGFDIMELAGSFELTPEVRKATEGMTWDEIRDEAWTLAMEEKYGKQQ